MLHNLLINMLYILSLFFLQLQLFGSNNLQAMKTV